MEAGVRFMSHSFLRKHSQPFVLYRDGERVGEVAGVKSAQHKVIDIPGDVEVFVGDWLEDRTARAWLHVTDVTGLAPKVAFDSIVPFLNQMSSGCKMSLLRAGAFCWRPSRPTIYGPGFSRLHPARVFWPTDDLVRTVAKKRAGRNS